MGLTQKYKQTQRQVRVQTNESNYAKGMWFTDAPLPEGYSKVLVNYDIDPLSGALKPRKGFRTIGFAAPRVPEELEDAAGLYTALGSKICSVSSSVDPREITRKTQTIVYNTTSKHINVLTCRPELTNNTYFSTAKCWDAYTADGAYITIESEPMVVGTPGIHGKNCVHNKFFDTPAGAFAFGNSFYTFVKRSYYASSESTTPYKVERLLCYTKRCADLQDDEIPLDHTKHVEDLRVDTPEDYIVCIIQPDKINPTEAASWGYNMLLDDPYDFVCEETATNDISILGIIPYDKNGAPALTPRKNQEITLKGFYRAPVEYHSNREISSFYATAQQKIDEYYETADISFNSLKVYYELDGTNYTETEDTAFDPEKTYYEHRTRDPKTWDEIADITVTSADYGNWWYCTDEENYYMVQPDMYEAIGAGTTIVDSETYWYFDNGNYYKCLGSDVEDESSPVYGYTGADLYKPTASTATASILYFGKSKPKASEKLAPTNSSAEDKIHVRWQMRESGASDWIDIEGGELNMTLTDYVAQFGAYTPFMVTVTLPSSEVLIRLLITDPGDPDTATGEEYVLSTNTIGLSLVSDELSAALNISTKKFDLKRCTGMIEWQKHLVLWGVPDALNTIFVSDVNNPTFFPYPNNIDTFTEPVVSVYNYGNELLVLTTSALYRLTWDAEGTGWTQRLVQQNLHITEADAKLACVFKNMFFFKSGELYYMMTPKATKTSSVQGSVNIIQISKPIEQLLNNFHSEVYELIKTLSNTPDLSDFTDRLVNYFTYIDGNKIVVNYAYALHTLYLQEADNSHPDNSIYIYVQLVYDTDLQAWCMKAFQAPHMIYPTHADTLQQEYFLDFTPSPGYSGSYYLQYYKFAENREDQAYQYITTHLSNMYCAVGMSDVYTEVLAIKPTTDTVAQAGKRYVDHVLFTHYTSPSGSTTDGATANEFELASLYTARLNKIPIRANYSYDIITGYDRLAQLDPGDVLPEGTYEFIDFKPRSDYFYISGNTITPYTESTQPPVYIYKRTRRRLFVNNYQYLDTGAYELNTELKKRFREFQFKIKNNTPDNLRFHTAFLVDGSTRTDIYKYTASYITDTATGDQVLVVTTELLDPNMTYDTTELGAWILNQSMFPNKTLHKIRMTVAGKGYSPRVKILSFNEKSYEILGHTWVYRTMNSR